MKANQTRRLLEPLLLPRLVDMLGDERTANGTALANAVATIAALEAARTGPAGGAPERRAARLDDADLAAIANHARDAIAAHYGLTVHLPSGAELSSYRPGMVKYGGRTTIDANGCRTISGGRCYQLSMAAPGLFLEDELPPDDEPVERFRRDLLEALRPLRPGDVPQLTLDDVRIERHGRWRHDIVTPVRSVAGETTDIVKDVGRIDLMNTSDWDAAIKAFVRREEESARLGPTLDDETIALRSVVTGIVDAERARGAPVRYLGVEVHPTGVQGGSSWTWRSFRIEGLDNSLKPATWTTGVSTGGSHHSANPPADPLETLARSVSSQMGVQRRRWRRLRNAQADGASGRIDTITLAALRAGDRPVADVLREVVESRRTSLRVPGHGTMRLSWRDGVVHSSFSLNAEVSWNYGRIILTKDVLSETMRQALRNQPISALIGHDFMDARATIRSITRSPGGWSRVNVAVASVPFDHRTGAILDEGGERAEAA